jgi:Na+-transporting NADH:ubiquinone oxidoreductase subunit F
MPKVTFKHSNKEVDAEDGEWLYDVCTRAESTIPFSCKAGACGTCAVEVLEGMEHLGTPGARELRTLSAHKLDAKRDRLACLHDVHGPLVFGKPTNADKMAAAGKSQVAFVESYRPLNLTVCEIRFYVKDPLDFEPGQYMVLSIPQKGKAMRRNYSIATPPADKNHFEICVRSVAGGLGSNFVHRLRPGKQVRVDGPYGDFKLNADSEKDVLMVATGTGMAPIKSMLMHLLLEKSDRKVRVFFGLRHESDLFYTDFLRGMAAHHPSFDYDIILSQPSAGGWAGKRGRVTDLINNQLTEGQAKNTEAYLCGSLAMIEDAEALLMEKGVAPDAIHYENFY